MRERRFPHRSPRRPRIQTAGPTRRTRQPPSMAVYLTVFALLTGAAAITLHLNPGLIPGLEPGAEAPGPEQPDEVSSPEELQRAVELARRQAELTTWEADLARREAALAEQEAEVDALLEELGTSGRTADVAVRTARLLTEMSPYRAAALLAQLGNGTAVEVLRQMKTDDAAAILAAMEENRAAALLRAYAEEVEP